MNIKLLSIIIVVSTLLSGCMNIDSPTVIYPTVVRPAPAIYVVSTQPPVEQQSTEQFIPATTVPSAPVVTTTTTTTSTQN